jgi:hypothetical protein
VSLTALDTGFFVRLPVHLQGDGRTVDRWRALVEGEGEGVVSGLSLVELLRLSLKGAIGREDAGLLLDAIPAVCRVVWPDWRVGERSGRRFGAPSPNERLPRPGPAPGGRPRPGHRPGGGGGGALDHRRPPDGLRGADAGGQAVAWGSGLVLSVLGGVRVASVALPVLNLAVFTVYKVLHALFLSQLPAKFLGLFLGIKGFPRTRGVLFFDRSLVPVRQRVNVLLSCHETTIPPPTSAWGPGAPRHTTASWSAWRSRARTWTQALPGERLGSREPLRVLARGGGVFLGRGQKGP